MKVSPSVLACDFAHMADEIRKVSAGRRRLYPFRRYG